MIYMAILVYFLFFSEGFGRQPDYSMSPGFSYNILPFREIRRVFENFDNLSTGYVIINFFGNIIAFIPFGALIRWVVNKGIKWYHAVLATFLFSCAVELIQMVTRVGAFDVDDIILNTFGGLLGFIVYYILLLINRKFEKKKES